MDVEVENTLWPYKHSAILFLLGGGYDCAEKLTETLAVLANVSKAPQRL